MEKNDLEEKFAQADFRDEKGKMVKKGVRMKTFLTIGICVILFPLFCLINQAESTNPKQRVGKDRGQVSAVEVVRGGFGSGPDSIGIVTPKEANPEGPMSFALGRNGEIYILWSGIWVDVEDRSVRVAKLDGTPDPDRISVPGKFSFDGRRLIGANKIGDAAAVIYRSKEDHFSKWDEYTVSFEMFIAHLLGLWDDRNGRIYLGAFLIDEPKSSAIVVVLTPGGKELGRVKLYVQKAPHEIYHSVRVSPDGHIFQMALNDRGVFVRRNDLTY